MKHRSNIVAFLSLAAACAAPPHPSSYLLATDLGKQVLASHSVAPLRVVFLVHEVAQGEVFAATLREGAPGLTATTMPAALIGIADQRFQRFPGAEPSAEVAPSRGLLQERWKRETWRTRIAADAKNPYLTADQPTAVFAVRIGIVRPWATLTILVEGMVLATEPESARGGHRLPPELLRFMWEGCNPEAAMTHAAFHDDLQQAARDFMRHLQPYLLVAQ